jgi:hypothetical protein
MSNPSPGIIPVMDSNNPRDPIGISSSGSPAANVRSPGYTNASGEYMYVVTGSGTNVYGLFANPDGSDIYWEPIGLIGEGQNVTAISSFNGTETLVGTDQGHIYQLTQPYTDAALD